MIFETTSASKVFSTPSVIRNLLRYLSYKELLQFRLINKAWRAEIDPFLQNVISLKKEVKLSSYDDVLKFTESFKNSPLVLIDSFRWQLTATGANNDIEFQSIIRPDFLNLVGDKTKFLHFINVNRAMELNLYEEILFKNFPNLVSLELYDDIMSNPEYYIFNTAYQRKSNYGRRFLLHLKMFKYYTNFTWYPVDESHCVLSREILKIAPNIKEIKVKIDEKAIGPTENVLQFTIASIANFGKNVEYLTFLNFVNLNSAQVNAQEDYLNDSNLEDLQLKRLTFIDNSQTVYPVPANTMSQMLETYESIWITVEEIRLGFDLQLNNDYQENRIEEMMPNTTELPNGIIIPFGNLRKFSLKNYLFCWDTIGEFMHIHDFVQQCPNLEDVEVKMDCMGFNNRMAHIIAYPFYVWLGNKFEKILQFSVTNVLQIWHKGEAESNLGISSADDLSDGKGNFLMMKIQKFDFSLIFSLKEFSTFNTEPEQIYFVGFLKEHLLVPLLAVGKEIAQSSTDYDKIGEVTRHHVPMDRLLIALYTKYADNPYGGNPPTELDDDYDYENGEDEVELECEDQLDNFISRYHMDYNDCIE